MEAIIHTSDAAKDILEITGTAKNKTEANHSLRYELSVISSSGTKSNNIAKNSQSGRFTLGSFETKNLSQTSISINPDHRTIVLLVLYDQDDKVVGADRKVYSKEEQEEAKEKMSYQKRNEGIIFPGMVTENTKTKPGKDFYDFFYQKYSLSPEKGSSIIHVDELVSFGRTTRIVVKVEERVVHQFIAQPKLDFLKNQAEVALSQVNRYFQYLKNRNENLNRY